MDKSEMLSNLDKAWQKQESETKKENEARAKQITNDLGRLGTADRYADLALMIANAEENWAAPDEAERAFAVLFNVLGIEAPDRERLAFYLRLDPLTWG